MTLAWDPQTSLAFHHLGVACHDLDRDESSYALLGYRREDEDFEDPTQGVRGRFLVGEGPRVELLQELPSSDTLKPWLSGASRVYHQAFTVPDIHVAQAALVERRARLVTPLTPAVAFDGRLICFLMLRTMLLVELIESP